MKKQLYSKLSLFLILSFLAVGCKKDKVEKPNPEEQGIEVDAALQSKMSQYLIPSMSFAVIRNEKLVYLKAYGISDKEANTIAKTTDLYRIASLSKPITLSGILKLVQDGKLSLDQKVFGPNGVLGNQYGVPPANSNKDLITVKHLIEHKSGWNNTPNDPMFAELQKTNAEIISNFISSRPLVSTPGTTEFYSNFGYIVLGRIIEKVSGLSYENYIKTNVLNPAGISTMEMAGNTLADRLAAEVKYYQSEYNPYTMNVRRMDSAGGWLASVTDLARFMVRVDRLSAKPDLVPASLLSQTYFGYNDWYHFGSLPGTTTIVGRLNSTTSYVILANTRSEYNIEGMINDLRATVALQASMVEDWPEADLF